MKENQYFYKKAWHKFICTNEYPNGIYVYLCQEKSGEFFVYYQCQHEFGTRMLENEGKIVLS